MIFSHILGTSEVAAQLKMLNSHMQLSEIEMGKYATIVKAMSAEEAKATLVKKRLSEAQAEEVIMYNTMIANSAGVSMATLAECEAYRALSTEQKETLITELGLQASQDNVLVSTNAITASKLREALTHAGVTKEVQAEIFAMYGLDVAEKKAATSGKLLGGVLTYLESHPIVLALMAIAGATYAAVKAFDYFTTTAEEATESLDEWNETVSEMNSSLEDQKSLAQEVKKSYSDWAKGVNNLNNVNINLSDADYESFINMNNRLAELFPVLKIGTDEYGNAIIINNY